MTKTGESKFSKLEKRVTNLEQGERLHSALSHEVDDFIEEMKSSLGDLAGKHRVPLSYAMDLTARLLQYAALNQAKAEMGERAEAERIMK